MSSFEIIESSSAESGVPATMTSIFYYFNLRSEIFGTNLYDIAMDLTTDPLLTQSIKIVCQYDRVGVSLLQRKLSLGYVRAARLFDQLEDLGVIGPAADLKPRNVNYQNYEEYLIHKSSSKDLTPRKIIYILLYRAGKLLQDLGERVYA